MKKKKIIQENQRLKAEIEYKSAMVKLEHDKNMLYASKEAYDLKDNSIMSIILNAFVLMSEPARERTLEKLGKMKEL